MLVEHIIKQTVDLQGFRVHTITKDPDFQRTSQGWPDRIHVKTILNRIEKQPGFIYDSCKWRDSGPPALVITLRPQVGSKPICSKCGERHPAMTPCVYGVLHLSPCGGANRFSFSTLQGGCSAQPVASRSKSCLGRRGRVISP